MKMGKITPEEQALAEGAEANTKYLPYQEQDVEDTDE